MSRSLLTILLLLCSNTFMTIAWYGHLRMAQTPWFSKLGLWAVVLISWSIALLEYCFMVPANRLGYKETGGPFSLVELKVIQEVITLTVFTVFMLLFFKNEHLRLNHLMGFLCLIGAVYFIAKK